jgi:hypothetical protein
MFYLARRPWARGISGLLSLFDRYLFEISFADAAALRGVAMGGPGLVSSLAPLSGLDSSGIGDRPASRQLAVPIVCLRRPVIGALRLM